MRWSHNPSLTTVWAIAFSNGMFVPGLGARWHAAYSASSMRRGSMTIRCVPASAACLMRAPTMGWFSVALAPQTRIVRARSMSSKQLVDAPAPSIALRAAALGA